MREEEKIPLDFDEVIDTEKVVAEQKSRKRLAFFLELIPLTILLIAFGLKYFEMSSWWWFFSVGAVMACLNYLLISWFFFKPRDFDPLELGVTVAFAICFALGIGSILLQRYSWISGSQLYSISLSGTCMLLFFSGLMLLINIRNEKSSRFYRLTLARLMILLAILLRVF